MTAIRPLLLLLLAGVAVSAAACATSTTPVATPATAPLTAAPAPVENYDWFLNEDGDQARLAYGLEESDDLRLGLDCRRGTGRLSLSAEGEAGAHEIVVESGGESHRFPAMAEPSEVNDGVFLTAQARTSEPVFQQFRRLGWLAIRQGAAVHGYAPHPASAPGVDRFFAFCG